MAKEYKFVRAFKDMATADGYADMLRENGYEVKFTVRYDTDSDYKHYLYAREG